MAIHLRPRLPAVFSDLTRSMVRETPPSLKRLEPIWSCSWRGLPSFRCHHRNWWALTPPFHPYPHCVRPACFLWHFPWSHPHWTLSSAIPFGVRTFLPEEIFPAAIWAASAKFILSPFQMVVKGLVGQGVGLRVLISCYVIYLKIGKAGYETLCLFV